MAAPKYASLHAGLLARKGEARPAAHQNLIETKFTDDPISLTPSGQSPRLRPKAHLSTSVAASVPTPTPAPTPTPTPSQEPAPKAAMAPPTRRAAVSISPRQKKLLTLLMVVKNRTHRDVVNTALDQYLNDLADNEMQHCACFRRALKGEA